MKTTITYLTKELKRLLGLEWNTNKKVAASIHPCLLEDTIEFLESLNDKFAQVKKESYENGIRDESVLRKRQPPKVCPKGEDHWNYKHAKPKLTIRNKKKT